MKVAVIGGGSTYTPELADGFGRLRDRLPVEELVLMDPSAERLHAVGGMASRIFKAHGHPGRVVTTRDPEQALDGADVVLIQLRVGGQQARSQDETWPLECGCVGQETTGAGGLAKALRTVPVVLDIAERARRANPEAWIVNFTNPVGIVTRALLQEGHRAVGLCNVAIGLQRHLAELIGEHADRISLDHFGLNHLTWVRAVRVEGDAQDRLPELLATRAAELAQHLDLPVRALSLTGMLPSYYLRYFYEHDAVVSELQGRPTRAQEVAELERELLALYADPGVTEKPALLAQRGGAYYSEAAVTLAASLMSPESPAADAAGQVQVVNVRNDGVLPFLPDDAVVEVPAIVTGAGARPRPVDPVPPMAAGLIAHVFAYEQLALEAALHGGRSRIERALLAHPLVGQLELAEGLADRLIAANLPYLRWAR
jgi:6-phospho-beta-glucosidase